MVATDHIRMRHRFEYWALRGAAGLLQALPLRAAMSLGWGMAWIFHHGLRFRAAEARKRIRLVLGPEITAKQVARIAWLSWRNLCFNAVELARLPVMRKADFEKLMPQHPQRVLELGALIEEHSHILLAVPHMGNWDISGIGLHVLGLPIFFIARRQKNPLADAYLNRMRGITGVETILNDAHVLKNVIRKLKQGSLMAILPDVRAKTAALPIRFLGGEANIGGGMGLFARQTMAPVVPAYISRTADLKLESRLLDPILPDPKLPKREDWLRMTQQVMTLFDQIIRQHPDQYFWYNKRWVLDPLKETTPQEPRDEQPG